MNFEQAMKVEDTGRKFQNRWGQWGELTEAAVRLALIISEAENVPASYICFTHAEESCWAMSNVLPNMNRSTDPLHWDFGPFQINKYWAERNVAVGFVDLGDLRWTDVFGLPYVKDGKPVQFTGSYVANGRFAARVIAAHIKHKSSVEDAIVKYTGPDAQPRRREDWKFFGPYFETLFKNYKAPGGAI